MSERYAFGPLALARTDLHGAVEWVLARARSKTPCVVVTSNIHHLALAERDAEFRRVVDRAELNVADGWPLVLASRIEGTPLPGRVAGVDLVAAVLASRPRLRIAVLGGAPGAAERLAEAYSGTHEFVLVDPLPMGRWEARDQLDELLESVRRAEPNLVLAAIGAPKQELLAERLRPSVQGPVICCGAAVEIISGIRPRAPRWLQSLGLEWAHRAFLEPRRLLPRYARAGTTFLRVLARELRSTPRGRSR
jgi:N-acetylglucosaminyldiphosphoundecaprenol N-acetyl-beta-D-mannosaminyltransferase